MKWTWNMDMDLAERLQANGKEDITMMKEEWAYIAALGMFEGKDETIWKDGLNPEYVETTADRKLSLIWRMWFRTLRRLRRKGKGGVHEHDMAY